MTNEEKKYTILKIKKYKEADDYLKKKIDDDKMLSFAFGAFIVTTSVVSSLDSYYRLPCYLFCMAYGMMFSRSLSMTKEDKEKKKEVEEELKSLITQLKQGSINEYNLENNVEKNDDKGRVLW